MIAINRDMIDTLNSELASTNCVVRIAIDDETSYNPTCSIVLANSNYVDTYTLNMNDEFYEILESFFTERGIKLSYNNNKDIFWSKFTND